jgi:protein LTV1
VGLGPKRINPFKELFPSDSEEEEDEGALPKAAAGNSARGGAARGGSSGAKGGAKKVNPFKELFPSDSEEEGEGDEESELGSRMEKVSVRGRVGADGRLLDARFEQLLADEYSDDEIGELDPDDPRLAGPAGLEAFDGVLDEYLHEQRTKKLEYVKVLGDGSSREWARLPAHERQPVPSGSSVDAGADAAGAASDAVDGATGSVAARLSTIDRLGNGVEAPDVVSDSDDDSIEENPFFEALKEGYRKEREWDAETILSTYSTTENHPTLVRCARKPAKGKEGIQLDRRTGLPVGLMLPAEEERRRKALADTAEEAGGNEEDERSEGAVEVFNAGAARPKDESKEEKRQRKAEAKAAQAARRAEKKATKTAFREERTEVAKAKHSTTQLPGQQSLSRW